MWITNWALIKKSSTSHCSAANDRCRHTSAYIRLSSCRSASFCRSRMLCCRERTCSAVSRPICLMLFRASSSDEMSVSPSSDSSVMISAQTSATWHTFKVHVRCVIVLSRNRETSFVIHLAVQVLADDAECDVICCAQTWQLLKSCSSNHCHITDIHNLKMIFCLQWQGLGLVSD